MRRKLLFLALVLASVFTGLQTVRPAAAASGCWQVDCNTCCKLQGGPVVCTERACV